MWILDTIISGSELSQVTLCHYMTAVTGQGRCPLEPQRKAKKMIPDIEKKDRSGKKRIQPGSKKNKVVQIRMTAKEKRT